MVVMSYYNPNPKFKIENKNKNKNEKEKSNKPSLSSLILTIYTY